MTHDISDHRSKVCIYLQQPIILAEDTQTPVLQRTASGSFVDQEGHTTDLTKYGMDLDSVTAVPKTQNESDDEFLQDIASTQDENASIVPTQMTFLPIPLINCTAARQSSQEVPVSSTVTSSAKDTSVIELSSGESNAKKRKLMSHETESDFFEDYLVELLDAGKTNCSKHNFYCQF